jgi:hypothetical protein
LTIFEAAICENFINNWHLFSQRNKSEYEIMVAIAEPVSVAGESKVI